MRYKQHTVWTWHDSEGVIRFVGYGMYDDDLGHPAVARFNERFNGDSELDMWLQSLDEEPTRKTFGNEVISFQEAIGFTVGLRAKHADTLLKSRGPSSYAGGHPKKGVYRFDMNDLSKCDVFESVREAAKAIGKNPSTVTRWCKDPKNEGWGYIDGDVET